jgi:hypothetical protein
MGLRVTWTDPRRLTIFGCTLGRNNVGLSGSLHVRRRLGVVPDRACVRQAKVSWTGDIVDAEFKENLRIFHRLIG